MTDKSKAAENTAKKEEFKTPLELLKVIEITGKRTACGGSQNVFVKGLTQSVPLMDVLVELNSRGTDTSEIEESLK